MNYVSIKEFFSLYSMPTVILAAIVAVIIIIVDKFPSKKIPLFVRNYTPFLLSILFSLAYDMIFVIGEFKLSESAFAMGLVSGSISLVIKSIVLKIISGKAIRFNPAVMIIEQLILGYVASESITKTAVLISEIILSEISEEESKQKIIETIKTNAQDEYINDELVSLADLIHTSIKNLNEEDYLC